MAICLPVNAVLKFDDDKGKVLKNSRIHNDLSKVGRFFDRIGGSGNSSEVKVLMESSCVWYNIYEYLSEERQIDVSLSNSTFELT
jgi:hypothetical protein